MVGKTKRTPESRLPPEGGGLRWSVERRLAFIEDRLFWLGEINRGAIVRRFDVSMSQASGDVARYLAMGPKDVDYDRSAKRYVAGAAFRPILTKPDAHRFLGELRLVEAGLLHVDETLAGVLPSFATTPLPERRIDAFLLRAVLQAIRQNHSLQVLYQSMSRPHPVQRRIEPHAVAYDGFRWHVRAFDRDAGEFRDFVFGRLSRVRISDPAVSSGAADVDWTAFVDLVIGPHPGLTEAQARAISLDYGIEGQSVAIKVRRALLFYALKRLGLDQDHNTRPPHVQQIVLLNREAIAPLIRSPQT